VQRLSGEDAGQAIEDEGEWMYIFNAICVDVAREQHKLTEADFIFLLHEHELSKEADIEKLYQDLTDQVLVVFGATNEVVDESAQQRQ